MSKKLLILSIAALSASSIVSSPVSAEEIREISFAKLPEAVQQSALKHMLSVSITKIEAIQEGGITKYEIESAVDGVNKDITLADNGSVLEIEQTIPVNQLPSAARTAIRMKYPLLKVAKLESVQKFSFDVEGDQEGKPVELKVLASGEITD